MLVLIRAMLLLYCECAHSVRQTYVPTQKQESRPPETGLKYGNNSVPWSKSVCSYSWRKLEIYFYYSNMKRREELTMYSNIKIFHFISSRYQQPQSIKTACFGACHAMITELHCGFSNFPVSEALILSTFKTLEWPADSTDGFHVLPVKLTCVLRRAQCTGL